MKKTVLAILLASTLPALASAADSPDSSLRLVQSTPVYSTLKVAQPAAPKNFREMKAALDAEAAAKERAVTAAAAAVQAQADAASRAAEAAQAAAEAQAAAAAQLAAAEAAAAEAQAAADARIAAEAEAIAIAEEQAATPQAYTWSVSPADGTIRQALMRWANDAGWTFGAEQWEVSFDIPITAPADLASGSFEDGVQALVEAVSLSETPVRACFYSNHLVRILNYNTLCDRTTLRASN